MNSRDRPGPSKSATISHCGCCHRLGGFEVLDWDAGREQADAEGVAFDPCLEELPVLCALSGCWPGLPGGGGRFPDDVGGGVLGGQGVEGGLGCGGQVGTSCRFGRSEGGGAPGRAAWCCWALQAREAKTRRRTGEGARRDRRGWAGWSLSFPGYSCRVRSLLGCPPGTARGGLPGGFAGAPWPACARGCGPGLAARPAWPGRRCGGACLCGEGRTPCL